MTQTPAFEDLLTLIDDRAAVLRSNVALSPGLEVPVPSCPDWSLRDLVEHLTRVHRFWAAAVAAGPSEKPPTVVPADGDVSADPLDSSAAATEELISALRTAGPGVNCWTWWAGSETPMTTGAVARHQVHEAAVHAFDAQLAAGTPQPVPAVVALDGIAEFITLTYATSNVWPHEPVQIGLHTAEGDSWLVDLTPTGSLITDGRHEAAVSLYGSASDLLLTLHRRLPLDSIRVEGDRVTADNLLCWPDLG